MNKSIRLTAFILAIVTIMTLIGGCAADDSYPAQLPENASMPPRRTTEGSAVSFDAELYFVSEDGQKLFSEKHEVEREDGTPIETAVLRELIKGPDDTTLKRSVPKGLRLEHTEVSLDVCNVYLTGTFPQDMTDWLVARAAIAATVCAAGDSKCVNVFCNGVEPGYNGRALGTMYPINESLSVYLKDMTREYELVPSTQGENEAYENNAVTLYFSDESGKLIMAEVTDISYPVSASNEEIATLLLNTLKAGDWGSNSLDAVLPAKSDFVIQPKLYYYGENINDSEEVARPEDAAGLESDMAVTGENEISTKTGADEVAEPDADRGDYTPPPPEGDEKIFIADIILSIEGENYNKELMCAAVTMTLTGYIPRLDGVRIGVMNENGDIKYLCETYFEKTDFIGMIGDEISLLYPDRTGESLVWIKRYVKQADTDNIYSVLKELLLPENDDKLLGYGLINDDVAELYVQQGTAIINWNAGFSDKLRRMIADENNPMPENRRELMLIYGIINTLCMLPTVDCVWMLEDGERISRIDNIYLGGALLESPGLVR